MTNLGLKFRLNNSCSNPIDCTQWTIDCTLYYGELECTLH